MRCIYFVPFNSDVLTVSLYWHFTSLSLFSSPSPPPPLSQLHRLALALRMAVVRRSGRYLFLQIMGGMLLRVSGSFLLTMGGTWRWPAFIGWISAFLRLPHLCYWPLAPHPRSCRESALCSERSWRVFRLLGLVLLVLLDQEAGAVRITMQGRWT